MSSSQDVDQETGEDLNPNRKRNLGIVGGDEAMRNPDFPVEAIVMEVEENSTERKRLSKITDLEKWEIKQVEPHEFKDFKLKLNLNPTHLKQLLPPDSDDRRQRSS